MALTLGLWGGLPWCAEPSVSRLSAVPPSIRHSEPAAVQRGAPAVPPSLTRSPRNSRTSDNAGALTLYRVQLQRFQDVRAGHFMRKPLRVIENPPAAGDVLYVPDGMDDQFVYFNGAAAVSTSPAAYAIARSPRTCTMLAASNASFSRVPLAAHSMPSEAGASPEARSSQCCTPRLPASG